MDPDKIPHIGSDRPPSEPRSRAGLVAIVVAAALGAVFFFGLFLWLVMGR